MVLDWADNESTPPQYTNHLPHSCFSSPLFGLDLPATQKQLHSLGTVAIGGINGEEEEEEEAITAVDLQR